MPTDVKTLREFADAVNELAEEWDGEQPVVLIGDVEGSVSVRGKDGFSKYGPVGYAQECFDGDGVFELGQEGDRRFFGTMFMRPEHIDDEALDQLEICRYCYHTYDDCTCDEAEEVED